MDSVDAGLQLWIGKLMEKSLLQGVARQHKAVKEESGVC